MKTLRSIYRRLDRLQHSRAFRIAATIVAVLACGAYFGSLVGTTTSLDAQRRALVGALTGQSLAADDEHAVSLRNAGSVTLDGRTYSDEFLADHPEVIFDDEGVVAQPRALAEFLLRGAYPTWAPRWLVEQPGTILLLGAVVLAWLLLIIWMAVTLPFVLTLLGTGLAVGGASLFGLDHWMWAFGGIGVLTFTFVLLARVALVLLNRPRQILAVAHTVVHEAARTRIPLVFIVLLLVVLPLLPLGLDPDAPLRFQMQTFISRSLGLTFYVAASMTLFLATSTVAFEIRDRQIWQLVTKPLDRFGYLLGKWIGVITVNAIIMVIASISIFMFIQYLRERPVASGLRGQEDRMIVRDAVLTARVGTAPAYEELSESQLQARTEELLRRRPELADENGNVPLVVRRQIRTEIQKAYFTGQRSIPPGGARDYVFTGLDSAKRLGGTLTLRYKFHILRDDEHETFPAIFVFNQDPNLLVTRDYVPTMTHVLPVPSELIREDGTLVVSIANSYRPPPDRQGFGSLNFEEDAFELLYKVATFEGNFVRAVLIDWVKLAFLAMLGICAATFLSFPVACLTSFTVFLAGTFGPFVAISLDWYAPPSADAIDWGNAGVVIQWLFETGVTWIAHGVVFLLEAFGQFRPTQALVEGRLIAWSTVGRAVLVIGGLWSGLALVVGWLVMRKRQLAIYSGQG